MNPAATTAVTISAAFLLGALSWQIAEYVLHRWLMHAMRGRGMASREHLTHHARRSYFTSNGQKALTASAAVLVMWPLAWLVGGVAVASAYVAGFVAAYLLYELLHRRAHTHAPRTEFGRRMRHHHFHHHFGRPLANHGVSTAAMDRLFGTREVPAVIRVPRRLAMDWLCDDDGEVRPEYSDDYVLVGRRVQASTDDEARDQQDAFANLAPSPR